MFPPFFVLVVAVVVLVMRLSTFLCIPRCRFSKFRLQLENGEKPTGVSSPDACTVSLTPLPCSFSFFTIERRQPAYSVVGIIGAGGMYIGGRGGVVSHTLEPIRAGTVAVDAKVGTTAQQATKHGTVLMLFSGTIWTATPAGKMEEARTLPPGIRHAMQKRSARAPSAVGVVRSSPEDLTPTGVITGRVLTMVKRTTPTGTAGNALQGRYRPTITIARPVQRAVQGSIQMVTRRRVCRAVQDITATELRIQDARIALAENIRVHTRSRHAPPARQECIRILLDNRPARTV